MAKKSIKRELTCFYSDGVEYQTCVPIAEEAEKRGYIVSFTSNKKQRAEIGLYCQHWSYPRNSKLSIVMLHDMAQGHGQWPNIWEKEPWDLYDIGILPGPAWERRWLASCDHPSAHPKIGMIRGGWPKADAIFDNNHKISKENIRKSLGVVTEKVILYAPSWENDGKQDEFVQALLDQEVDLFLKQAPWSPESHKFVIDNIERMNALHRGLSPKVHIIERDTNIFDCIAASDIIVSEESSVMFEGLLLGVPSVAVTDWMIPDRTPSRFPSIPYDFVIKCEKTALCETVQEVLSNYEKYSLSLQAYREDNFYDVPQSSVAIMDQIDRVLQGETPDMIKPVYSSSEEQIKYIIRKQFRNVRHLGGKILWKLGLQ